MGLLLAFGSTAVCRGACTGVHADLHLDIAIEETVVRGQRSQETLYVELGGQGIPGTVQMDLQHYVPHIQARIIRRGARIPKRETDPP